MSVVTDAHRGSWEEDGWCVIERAVGQEDLAGAQKALTRMFPTAAEMAAGGSKFDQWRTWDAAWPEFPFHSASMNRIALGGTVLDLAASFLGTDEVRLYIGIVTAKYGSQPSDYNRLLHLDYPNNTLTVPSPSDPQVELFVYLSDVGEQNGATRFVSRQKTSHIPVAEHTLNLVDHASLYDDPSIAAAPAGSFVVYRPDVYHRSVDFTDPDEARFMMHLAFKSAAMEWGGFQAWPVKGFSPDWYRFVSGASPRELVALGFPGPGHPFWNDQTLHDVAGRYPDLDLSPWRAAL